MRLFMCLVVFFTFHNVQTARLSEPKILLPYHSTSATSYEIKIFEAKGCFKWKSSRPDVATVSVNGDPSCSHSVTVTATSRSAKRLTAILLAENQESGETLRCDVIVDSIKSIGIETTTRELYLEDSPEKFQLFARDGEGNTFSTLVNTAFEWSLVSDEGNGPDNIVDARNILRILTFKESNYDTPPHIERMESQGLQGDTILVEGVKTGSARVHVRLKDSAYKEVTGETVRLVVVANAVLNPPLSYIMLFTSIKYQADLIKQGIASEIKLPSEQYHLEVVNRTVCSLDIPSSTVTGEDLGRSEILLKDINMPSKLLEDIHQPSATIYVVLPARLEFSVLPDKKWVLEAGRVYEVSVEAFDKDSHKIFLSHNVQFKTVFDEAFFDVLRSSQNESYHVVKAKKSGKTEVDSSLTSVKKANGNVYKMNPPIKGAQPLEIFDPITMNPSRVIFPWIPEQSASHSIQITAEGGSGDFTWSSNDTSLTEVPKRGKTIAVTANNKIGTSLITVKDFKNSRHTATGLVSVIPPDGMVFNPKYVEAEVGTEIELPLTIYAIINKEKIAFEDCTKLPLRIVTGSDVFVHDANSEFLAPSKKSQSCVSVRLMAKRRGHTVVAASYSHGGVLLNTSITVAAFDSLRPVNPTEYTVLSVGSMREVVFKGGPQPWVLDTSQYVESTDVSDTRIVSPHKISASTPFHRLYVECLALGEQDVHIKVGNNPTSTNNYPQTRSASVKVLCKEPAGLSLVPRISQPTDLKCPVMFEAGVAYPAQNYLPFDILVTVTDDQGRQFDNISSLSFDWLLSDSSLAIIDVPRGIKSNATEGKHQWFQTLSPRELSGELKVSLRLTTKLKQDLTINLVDDSMFSTERLTLFNHPDSKDDIRILGGSGHFQINRTPYNLASAKLDETNRIVTVVPHYDGDVDIQLRDLCLTAKQRAHTRIRISGANSVVLAVRDKVQKESSLMAYVKVKDGAGNYLPADHFELMVLKPNLDLESQRYIKVLPGSRLDNITAVYEVMGVELGTARLSFTVKAQSSNIVTSNRQSIQVFPPIRLEPKNVTLLIGGMIQLEANGGPQPHSSIEFLVIGEDSGIASVSGGGLVSAASLGTVTVRAQAVGIDEESGENVVFSYDEGQVHVVKLMGIRLYTPLTRLQTNTRMPVYVLGLNEHETPFSFANLLPSLKFKWTVTNREVASLKSVYHKSSIELPADSSFSYQLHTYREGHVTIRVQVAVTRASAGSLQQLNDNQVFSDEAHIQIFDPLELLSPSKTIEHVLITPNTVAKLRTNRDNQAKMTYKTLYNTDLLTIDGSGKIETGSSPGVVPILMTSVESFGANQTSVLQVKIKPVRYLMLNSELELRTTSVLTYIPVGSVLTFRVSHHDDFGQVFDFANSQLRFRSNRFDVLHAVPGMDNDTVIVRVPKVSLNSWDGTAFKAWDVKQPRIADYININVQNAIVSESKYQVGDVICFSSPLLASSGEMGVWTSEDPSLLFVKPNSGESQALSPGTTTLVYNMSAHSQTFTQIQISPLESISIVPDSFRHVTIGKRNYTIPVKLNGQMKTPCAGVQRPAADFPYKCSVAAKLAGYDEIPEVSKMYKVAPLWDSESGAYGCLLTPLEMEPNLKAALSLVEGVITIISQSNEGKIAVQLDLQFLPPPFVRTRELFLSPTESSADIIISASGSSMSYLDLKIEGRLASYIHASTLYKQGNLYKYTISLTSAYSPITTEGTVMLTDSLTSSAYSIPVHLSAANFTQDGRSSSVIGTLLWNNLDLALFLLLCVVVTSVCIFLGYSAVTSNKSASSDGSTNSPRIFASSPISSVGSSSIHTGDPLSVSPVSRHRQPAGKVALWSSGYEPQEPNQSDLSLFKKSPNKFGVPPY